MTLLEMQTMQRDYATALGNQRGVPTTEDTLGQIDWALKLLAQKCHFYDPAIAFTPTEGKRDYRLNSTAFEKRVYLPHSVQRGERMFTDAGGLRPGLWSVREMDLAHPTWRVRAAGSTARAIYFASGQLWLDPKPDAAAAADDWFIAGEIVPGYWLSDGTYARDLTALEGDLTAEPDVAEPFHELVAVLAAVKAAWPAASSEMAVMQLRQFSADIHKQIEELELLNKSALMPWGSQEKPIYNPTTYI